MGLCLLQFDERLLVIQVIFPAWFTGEDFDTIHDEGSTAAEEAMEFGQTAGSYVMTLVVIAGVLDALIGAVEDLDHLFFHAHLPSLVQDIDSGFPLVWRL
jgi:hypothetical protein